MDAFLSKLLTLIHPPSNPPNAVVDWPAVESAIGIQYPPSFKEFITEYGRCVWFDHFAPFYCATNLPKAIKEYQKTIQQKLVPVKDRIRVDRKRRDDIAVYPEANGLFPFGIDYSSSVYLWHTVDKNPEKWPIVCWFPSGDTVFLNDMTISKMLVLWLTRDPVMTDVWGDRNDLPAERIAIAPNT